MTPLSKDDVAGRLEDLEGWAHREGGIEKTFRLPSFPEAIAFVGRVADRASDAPHAPEIDIRYDRVRVRLSNRAEGGVTESEIALAAAVERSLPDHGPS